MPHPHRHPLIILSLVAVGVGLLVFAGPAPATAGGAPAPPPQWGTDIRVDSIPSNVLAVAQNFSLAINPAYPDDVLAGFDTWNSAPSNSMYARSTDGGRTWQSDWLYGPWFGDGSPYGFTSVGADAQGTFYFTSQFYGNVQMGFAVLTATHGSPLGAPTMILHADSTGYYDQGQIAVDPRTSGPNAGSLYFVARYFTNDAQGLWFSYSRDHGHSWSPPVAISDPAHNYAYGPSIGVGPDGTVYVAFAYLTSGFLGNDPSLYVDRSTDGGVTWSGDQPIAGGLQTHVGALDAENHELMLLGNDNQQGVRITNTPYLAVAPDQPQTLYAVWNDGRWETSFTFFGHPGRHSDILFARSVDGGATWSAPIRVNDDAPGNGVDQFLPTIAVQAGGMIGVTWYDRRVDPSHYLYDLFYSQSTDGGVTWSPNQRVSDQSSDPLAVVNGELNSDVGVYSALAFGPDYVLPSWIDTRGGRAKNFYTDRGVFPGAATPTPVPSATPSPSATAPPSPTPAPPSPTRPASTTPTASVTPVPPGSPSPVPSATPVPTGAASATPVPTGAPSTTPQPPGPTATPSPCAVTFSDVPPDAYYAVPVEWLACRGVISGYADGTFRPFNPTTRGQLTKLVALGFGWPLQTPATPTFQDVPPSQPFYAFVETAVAHGVIAGYDCGGVGEPCPGRYFRPGADVTRGQLAKIVVGAAGWPPLTPPTPTFVDVPAGSPFFGFVEQAVAHGVIAGYDCGGTGEPCPGRYFRAGASSTRGQLSKILYNVLTAP